MTWDNATALAIVVFAAVALIVAAWTDTRRNRKRGR